REDPGAENHTESRKTAEDLGVRVSFKTRFELHREGLDLSGHLGHDPNRGAHHVAVSPSQERRRLELVGPKGLLDLLGTLGDAPPPASSLQSSGDPVGGKRPPLSWRRRRL